MRNFISLAFIAIQAALAGIVGQSLYANSTSSTQSITQSTHPEKDAFTGKILRNKVRIRLQPTLDSLVLHEVNRGDMLIVDREEQDFFRYIAS